MRIVLENLELLVTEKGKVFRCCKCGYDLGQAAEGFRRSSLKVERPISYGQPGLLSPKTDKYVLTEYCCPKCAALFETEMAIKGSEVWESIQLE